MTLIAAGQAAPSSTSPSTPTSTVGLGPAHGCGRRLDHEDRVRATSCKYSYQRLDCGAERNQPCHARPAPGPADLRERRRPQAAHALDCRQRGTRQRMNDAKMRPTWRIHPGKNLPSFSAGPDIRRATGGPAEPAQPVPIAWHSTCDAAPTHVDPFPVSASTEAKYRMNPRTVEILANAPPRAFQPPGAPFLRGSVAMISRFTAT
jgi:hypothetical protein